ncbi:MAG TPA: hypothetical protein VK034_00315, partial [Enhygromyxa sp.]|nr:hypothetical protein [Enhygromyxa sp.]
MTDPLISSITPRVRIEGSLDEELTLELLDLRIAENLDGLKTLELGLFADGPNPDPEAEGPAEPRFLDGAKIDFGKRVEIVLGPDDDP